MTGPRYTDIPCHRGKDEHGRTYCVGHGQDWPCKPTSRDIEAEAVEAAAHSLAINHRHFTEAADILRHYAREHRTGSDRLSRYSAAEGTEPWT